MKNYCVEKYSVEQLDRVQDRLTSLIYSEKRAKISLNHYNERVEECEKMLEANEGLRKVSEEVYIVHKKIHEDNIRDYKKFANRMEAEIEEIENEIERLRKKYCL
jgi:galactokinase